MAHVFDLKDAQCHATLASIAYAGDTLNGGSPSIDALHAAIDHQLSCYPQYACGTDWSLVWGPVETAWTDNLMYAAINQKTKTLAVVIRGTTTQTLSRLEDVPRSFSTFPDPKGDARVSGPFLDGVERMLAAKDQWHKATFKDFLQANYDTLGIQKVVVSGHSQGASLVPLMMLALQRGLCNAPKIPSSIDLSGYALAPPTTGSPEFAKIVDSDCACWFIINPKDILPLGYNAMYSAITDGIPIKLGYLERGALEAIVDAVNLYIEPSEWAQPSQRAVLEGCSTRAGLLEQIDQQHNYNAYLTKLGVASINVGEPSAFPVSDPPRITIS